MDCRSVALAHERVYRQVLGAEFMSAGKINGFDDSIV
jgi:hypothetical protein